MFHFKPVAQFYTSTCWSFSATSFYESEIFRLYGKKVKLSEMWTAYYELIAKSERYIRERGHSYVAGGGETSRSGSPAVSTRVRRTAQGFRYGFSPR